MVFDEAAGVAYESYNAEQIRAFLILVHYTDLDLAEYDTPEGRYAAQDAVASHGLWRKILDIVEQDVNNVDAIAARLRDSAKYCFERQHSLEYRLAKVFEALLGTEDLMETIAKAEDLNSKLIDMLGAVRKQPAPMAGGGLQFAKKD